MHRCVVSLIRKITLRKIIRQKPGRSLELIYIVIKILYIFITSILLKATLSLKTVYRDKSVIKKREWKKEREKLK